MLIGVISKNPVDGRTPDSKCGRDGARRLTAGVHPLRQSGFGFIESLRSSDVLPARATRPTGSGAAFPAKL